MYWTFLKKSIKISKKQTISIVISNWLEKIFFPLLWQFFKDLLKLFFSFRHSGVCLSETDFWNTDVEKVFIHRLIDWVQKTKTENVGLVWVGRGLRKTFNLGVSNFRALVVHILKQIYYKILAFQLIGLKNVKRQNKKIFYFISYIFYPDERFNRVIVHLHKSINFNQMTEINICAGTQI